MTPERIAELLGEEVVPCDVLDKTEDLQGHSEEEDEQEDGEEEEEEEDGEK